MPLIVPSALVYALSEMGAKQHGIFNIWVNYGFV